MILKSKINFMVSLFTEMERVMKDVAKNDLELDMDSYFAYASSVGLRAENATIHNCGTPACIAGYCSLDEEVCKIAEIEKADAGHLHSLMDEYVFKDCCMGDLIFTNCTSERWDAACLFKEFCLKYEVPFDNMNDFFHADFFDKEDSKSALEAVSEILKAFKGIQKAIS